MKDVVLCALETAADATANMMSDRLEWHLLSSPKMLYMFCLLEGFECSSPNPFQHYPIFQKYIWKSAQLLMVDYLPTLTYELLEVAPKQLQNFYKRTQVPQNSCWIARKSTHWIHSLHDCSIIEKGMGSSRFVEVYVN